MLSDLTADQLALAQHMSDLSEQAYSAGWMQDLEYVLWEALLGRRREFGHLTFADQDSITLRALSDATGGWIVFDETREHIWIPNADWDSRFHAWSGSSQPSVAKVVRPVDANEGRVRLVFTLVHVFTSRTVGERDMRGQHPAKAIRRAGDAAFPEYSLTGLAAPAGAKASWKASRARR